jgi:hypothetical protein
MLEVVEQAQTVIPILPLEALVVVAMAEVLVNPAAQI